jgi:hypothetical protein
MRKRVRGLVGGLVVLGMLASVLGACGDSSWGDGDGPYGQFGGGGSTETPYYDAGLILGDGSASAHPIKAIIDPNASMLQSPGKGVGVFAQYDTGGHWYVWWTCDTALSGDSCPFNVEISAAGGIENVVSQGFAGKDGLVEAGADAGDAGDAGAAASFTAQTTTTTMVQGVRFDTDPGAVITLSASLGGEYSGSFLFFVQDHLVNGGYKGVISDPLELEPSSP